MLVCLTRLRGIYEIATYPAIPPPHYDALQQAAYLAACTGGVNEHVARFILQVNAFLAGGAGHIRLVGTTYPLSYAFWEGTTNSIVFVEGDCALSGYPKVDKISLPRTQYSHMYAQTGTLRYPVVQVVRGEPLRVVAHPYPASRSFTTHEVYDMLERGAPVASYDVLPMHVAFFCKYPLPSKHSTEDLLNKMRQAFDRNQRIWSAIQKASG